MDGTLTESTPNTVLYYSHEQKQTIDRRCFFKKVCVN